MDQISAVERKTSARGTKLGSVMVVGAGVAGMQSALDLANSGYLVHLVTSDSSIGGKMAQLDKTFPTNDCAMCLLGPRMTDTQNHPNIQMHTCSDLLRVEGKPGNFTAAVRRRPRYVDVGECTACGDCEAVCPVEVANRFNEGLSSRKAIHKLFPQAVPNKYLIEKRGTPPCRHTCPAGCNVQGYVALISQGKFAEALDVIRRRMPFAGVCGRVCHHPCESECNRGEVDDPVSVAALKRAAADFGWEGAPVPERAPLDRSEKVAIVGGGPAGLTAALELAHRGYPVTIFDGMPKAGGMMRYGIPRYRLTEELVEREVNWILDQGVEFRGGVRVGSDVTLAGLRDQGYHAILLAVGMQKSRGLRIEGSDLNGVMYGVDFLRDINVGRRPRVGEKVLIIGGGNVAIDAARSALRLGRQESDQTVALDAARSALRLGAKEVHLVCLESREEMPAHEWEVDEAVEEGIFIHHRLGPKRILGQDGWVSGIEMQGVSAVFDPDGRFNPKFVEGSEAIFDCDTVIMAIGQTSDLELLASVEGLEATRQGTIVADALTRATPVEGIFAAGDAVNGPASVVDSVASGREAAISIDRYLRGEDLRAGRGQEKPPKLPVPEDVAVAPGRRLAIRRNPQHAEMVKEGTAGFGEVLIGYDAETAVAEAKRCLNCGICAECLQCEVACQKKAIHHDDAGETFELAVGAVILTPGFDLFDARLRSQYGYGIYPNVMTSLEYERLLSATGPTQGHVRRLFDGKKPGKVAFIQCVGSRDCAEGPGADGAAGAGAGAAAGGYCSSICCMYTAKEALITREHEPDIEPTVFYLDVRSYGKGFDRYVEAAKARGVRYTAGMVSQVKEDPISRDLEIRYLDEEGRVRTEVFDLVVLAVGVRPPKDAAQLAEACDIRLNEDGFAWTHWSHPTETSRRGVFVAGAFQGPRDIPETVMNASAAAAQASALLAPARGTLVRRKAYPPERDVRAEEPRVGVYICRCGINISGVVDVAAVTEYAQSLPGVVIAEENLYTCSQDTLARIGGHIKEHGLNRVVVASCTIRTHQPLFREALREAGLNQFLFEMANIRDQCSWVHRDTPVAATAKALDLVRMAVAKVRRHEPLHMVPVAVTPRALVIGGGIAGMTAALTFAQQGFETYLLERQRELGGNLRHLHFTLESDNIQGYLADLIRRVEENSLIHVFTECRIEEFGGHAGHFTTTISQPAQAGATGARAATSGAATATTAPTGGPRRTQALEHGVVVVATGAQETVPRGYLYGEEDAVITGLEFEELVKEGDPWTARARQIVMIQCVGSRDETNRYCSRTCCAESVKNALAVKKRNPKAEVVVLYRDLRTYGLMEHFYRRAREAGVLFIRFPDERPPLVSRPESPTGRLAVEVMDGATGEMVALSPDLIVLAAATVPSDGARELASLLKVPVNEDGFFLETHAKLSPMDFPSQGVYLCGGAHSPKFATESVYQAQGAAARAATILSQTNLMVGGVVATVDGEKCAACLTCVRVCPFSVPRINLEGEAEIEAVACQGCGTCASECPGKAIQLQHYNDTQLLAKVAGVFFAQGAPAAVERAVGAGPVPGAAEVTEDE
jgi:heterodisulfide reductase subunit A-like polyferredoxin